MKFSETVTSHLKKEKIPVSKFARLMGFSVQHAYCLLKGKKRWNEDSINNACSILGLEIKIENRTVKKTI